MSTLMKIHAQNGQQRDTAGRELHWVIFLLLRWLLTTTPQNQDAHSHNVTILFECLNVILPAVLQPARSRFTTASGHGSVPSSSTLPGAPAPADGFAAAASCEQPPGLRT